MEVPALLDQPHLSLITRHVDHELSRIQDVLEHKVLVDGRAELEEVLGELLASKTEPAPKTLDLIGHSTPDSLLLLGDWAIDAARPSVKAFFRELADNDVLPRLGVRAVRLLGCQTADTDLGRATICMLADILELEVYGTTQMVYSAHYDAHGFRDECRHVLVCAGDVRRGSAPPILGVVGEPYRRVLDIDSLPSSPLGMHPSSWSRRLADLAAARRILQLVRRTDGAQMPGLLASPSCEVALPAAKPGWYHRIQILIGGEFVRVYPDGDAKPGVVFPIDDPHALIEVVEGLPLG